MNKTKKDELEQLSREGLQKIRNYLKNPEDIKELSDFMAQFNNYSIKNQALIQQQYKGALAVGSFNFFKENGLRINKGEKALKIYAPREYQVVRLENGKGLTPKYWTDEIKQGVKEGKYQVEKHQTFVPVPVFDILQTNAKAEDLPKLYPNRPFNFDFSNVKNTEQLLHSLFQLANKHDIGIQYAPIKEMGASKGKSITYLENNTQVILLNKRLSKEEQIPTLIHELTHAFIHQKYKNKEYDRHEQEFQAEFCSYLTCKTFGIDTSEEAIPYIAEWTKNLDALDDQALVQQLNLIKETSAYITDEVMEYSKNQLVPKTKEQLQETLNSNRQTQISEDRLSKGNIKALDEYAKQIVKKPSHSLSEKEMINKLTNIAKKLNMTIKHSKDLSAGKGLNVHYGMKKLKENGSLEDIEDKKEKYEQTLFISKENEVDSMIEALSKGIVDYNEHQLNKKYSSNEKSLQVDIHKYLLAYQLGVQNANLKLQSILESLSSEKLKNQLNIIKNTYQNIQGHQNDHKENPILDKIQVKTTFKGHDFIYEIHINPKDKYVSGTYQRDNEPKHTATESACLSALRYVIENHNLNQKEVQYLNEVIHQGTERLNQETQPSHQLETKVSEKNHLTWKEQLEYARSANIIEVAQSVGLQLIREGNNQYRDVNNHSMVFRPSKNSYYENNGQFGGDPIHFVQNVVGIQDFKDAVQYLNDQQYGQVDLEALQRKEPYQYDASKESKDFSKARQYLVQERGIDGQLVDKLHQMGLIRQDKRNNVLFMWNDNGKSVGCTEQGTVKMKEPINGRDHWKGIQRNSESNHGFNFGTGEPKHLKFFEAPIDALSYASLKGLEPNTRYVAMDGLKENTVIQFIQKAMEKTDDHIESIQLCVDNDEAGDKFIQKFNQIKQLDAQGNDVLIKIEGEQPNRPQNEEKWDWNNELIFQSNQISQQKKYLENYEEYGLSIPLLENLIENNKIEVTENNIIFKENEQSLMSYQLEEETQEENILNNELTFSIGEEYPEQIMLFKNPLELISYLSIHSQEEDTCYISTNNFDEETIQTIMDQYQSTVQEVTVGVANQYEAENIYHDIESIIPESIDIHSSSEPIASSYFKKCHETNELQQQMEGQELA